MLTSAVAMLFLLLMAAGGKMAQMQRYTTIPGVKIQAIYGLPPPILRHPARKSSTLHPPSSQAPRYAALHR